jgi:hypothetical protein
VLAKLDCKVVLHGLGCHVVDDRREVLVSVRECAFEIANKIYDTEQNTRATTSVREENLQFYSYMRGR